MTSETQTLPNPAVAVNKRSGLTNILSQLSFFMAFLSLVLVGILHIIKPELAPSWHMLSEYAIGENGWLMQLSFFCWAFSCFALFLVIRKHISATPGKIGLVFLLLTSLALIMGGLFVMDAPSTPPQEQTVRGSLHGLSAMIGLPSQAIAALLLTYSLAKKRTWLPSATMKYSAHLVWITMTIMFASVFYFLGKTQGQFTPEVKIGWPNRLLILAYCAWLMIMARKASLLLKN